MLSKSALKRLFIIEKATDLFMERGFQSVTMSDIVESCRISRGGLYRYFKNTNEIFLEILHDKSVESHFNLKLAMKSERPAPAILEDFFAEQKRDLLHIENTLTIAVYEFFFLHKNTMKENVLQKQFEQAEEVLQAFIQYGIDRKEFKRVIPRVVARNIIMVLEGIRVSGQVMSVNEVLIDEQYQFIKGILINKVD